jgi:putative pyruvate formate lyase activating enzyme
MWRNIRPDAVAILNNELARKSLSRYFAIMQNQKPAKFVIAKNLQAEFCSEYSLQTLWQKHEKLTRKFYRLESQIDVKANISELPAASKSYLDLKIEIARRLLQSCNYCHHKCGVNRLDGKLGYCSCGDTITMSSIFEHLGEEPELVPSGTIFTMGCTMRCIHCQNWTISQWMEPIHKRKPAEIAKEIENLRAKGCRNANLVGGEPTPWLQQWLEIFGRVNVNIPVIWNSNSYYSPETANLLHGFADVYLLDFKYGPGDCSERISKAPHYWEVCTRNHLEAKKNGELIIRVLVLPGHIECCTEPTLHWIAKHLGNETRVNIMFQYRPEWRAHEIPELRNRLSKIEIEKASQLAKKFGLTNLV